MTIQSDMSLLAAGSYWDIRKPGAKFDNRAPIPEGWRVLTQYDTSDSGIYAVTGFSARVYENISTGEIVISYAGTEFDTSSIGLVADFLSGNIPLALGKYGEQALAAAKLYQQVKADTTISDNISFTGHSLGGGLASMMAVWFNRPAYVFAAAPFQNSADTTQIALASAFSNPALYQVKALLAQQGFTLDPALASYNPLTDFTVREANVIAYAIKGEQLENNLGLLFNWIEGSTNSLFNNASITLSEDDKHSIDLHVAALLSNTFQTEAGNIPTALARLMDKNLYGGSALGNQQLIITKLIRNEVGVRSDDGTQVLLNANQMLTHFANDLQKLGTTISGLNTAAQDALIAQGIEWYYWQGTDYAGQEFFTVTGKLLQYTSNYGQDNSLDKSAIKASPYASKWLQSLDSSYGIAGTMPVYVTFYQQWSVNTGTEAVTANAKNINKTQMFIGNGVVDTFTGGNMDDVFLAGGGADILDGGLGNDYMHGGAGADIYKFNGNFGIDTVVDADGAGTIKLDDIALVGGNKIGDGIWKDESQPVIYTFLVGIDGKGTLQITRKDQVGNTIRVLNWQNGQLGITLNETAAVPEQLANNASALADKIDVTLMTAWTFIDGLAGNDQIYGGVANDMLLGSIGSDIIQGGAGDDVILSGMGLNSSYLPNPLDYLPIDATTTHIYSDVTNGEIVRYQQSYHAYAPDIFGRSLRYINGLIGVGNFVYEISSEIVYAGNGSDYVITSQGDDQVLGGSGNDYIYGLSGNDVLEGEADEDYIDGDGYANTSYLGVLNLQYGNDYIDGGDGDDHLIGNGGDDEIYGGAGFDVISGDALNTPSIVHGKDYIDGESGNDIIWGLGDNDEVYGGIGDDYLWGDYFIESELTGNYHGDDYLDGEDGNDQLVGDGGNDTLYGGLGDDYLVGDEDLAVLSGIYHGKDYLDGEDGDDHLYGGGNDDQLIGGEGNDNLYGDNFNITLNGIYHGNDYLEGGAGNDYLLGGGGGDTLLGGIGDDELYGDFSISVLVALMHGNDYLDGGDGIDKLIGNAGNDTLFGGTGDDELFGDASDIDISLHGNDSLDGGEGNDILDGQGGDDTLLGDSGADMLLGGGGDDSLSGGADDDQIFGDAGNIDISLHGDDFLDGGEGNDYLVGSAGNDILSGGAGSDQLWGDSSDSIIASHGNDYLDGGDGVDYLIGGGGNDTLIGGAGNDQMRGDSGDDELYGNEGDDYLYGREGMDKLDGGIGNDFIYGGTGEDTYYYGKGYGNDVFEDSNIYEPFFDDYAVDTVLLFDIQLSEVTFQRVYNSMYPDPVDLLITVNSTQDTLRIVHYFAPWNVQTNRIEEIRFAGNVSFNWDINGDQTLQGSDLDDVFNGAEGVNYIYGNGGIDTIYGGASIDYLDGGLDNDILYGGMGNDYITGGGGGDVLSGDAGNDDLYGGWGDDFLNGGTGSDFLSGGDGNDVLWDFNGITVVAGNYSNEFYSGVEYDSLSGSNGNDIYSFGLEDGYKWINNYSMSDDFDVIQFDSNEITQYNTLAMRMFDDLVIKVTNTSMFVIINQYFLADETNDGLTYSYKIDQIEFSNGIVWDQATIQSKVDFAANNQAPILAAPLNDMIAAKGELFTYTLPANTFLNTEAWDTLTFSANNLGSWLSYDPDTRTISGTPSSVGNNQIWFTATDIYGYSTTASLNINVFNTLIGSINDDILIGSDENDNLIGLAGNDTLYGGIGDDLIEGGEGVDTLYGGLGDDIFIVNSSADTIVEYLDEGFDTVQSDVMYTLSSNIEKLTLTGSNAINGTGNEEFNVLEGNSASNILSGLGESDTYIFGLGSGADTILETSGSWDSIVFKSEITSTQITATRSAGMITLHVSANDSISFQEISANNYAIEAFYFDDIGDYLYADWVSGLIHDSPTATNLNTAETYTEDTAKNLVNIVISDTDSTTTTATVTLSDVNAGSLNTGTSGAVTSSFNATTGVWRASGSIANVNTLLAALTFTPKANYNSNFSMAISVTDGNTPPVTGVKNFTGVAVNDAPTGTISITGTAAQNQTLTANHTLADFDGMGAVSYQWKAAGVAIAGATGNTLTLGQAQVGKAITVTASYTDGFGTAESKTSTATASVANVNDTPTGAVTIAGTATQGQTLTASHTLADLDGLGTISYQWKAAGVNIAGATTGTLVLGQAQVGKAITVTASYTDAMGTAESVSSTATTAVVNTNDAPTGTVTIAGTASLNQTLTANHTLVDPDGLGTIAYQWNADGVAIAGATVNTLVLTQTQVGKVISVTASYTDGFGTAESKTSANTPLVTGLTNFTGTAGADTMAGTTGADQLTGLAGNDTYTVNNVGDIVVEALNAGTDQVNASVSYTLSANVEKLTLTGSTAINATGNTLNNTLTGNTGNNILDGGAGADTMVGGTGNDTYVVDNAGDITTEAASGGTDLVQSYITWTLATNLENLTLTGTAAINATGNTANNVLTGNSADNVINGGTGNDTMVGGAGNDTYVVNVSTDVVTELANEGTDTVQSSVTLTLGNNVENLTLTGTTAINGTGNTLDNVLTGNSANNTLTGGAGNDTLNGGTGNDTMKGGTGNDTYVVNVSTDVVTELANEGTDTVQSSVTLTLGSNVENLTLTGTTAINGTGNTLDNVLTGNSANNTLTGAAGNDTLSGGAGADALVGGAGNDTYWLARGFGFDTITENDTTAGNTDIARFDTGIASDQLWFVKTGNNLEVSIIGTTDKFVMSNWYLGNQYHTEQFKTSDGKTLLDSQVQNLVSAMAGFAPPAAGQNTLSAAYATALNPVITANWV